ncbi:MAG: oligosaccharide flippase family protein [Candidatus Cloacimonetes bacterium]|nr:oligosaccharide flippase family protein [Candidatus Cloacimonadota bacterium]
MARVEIFLGGIIKKSLTHSLKWVFSTTVIRRFISFILFLYIVRYFDRADLGIYRAFSLILSFSALVSVFGFGILNIVEKSKKYLKYGLQFVLFSSLFVSLILFFLRGILAEKYSSSELYLYILYGFWLVIPLSIKILIKSLYELEMNFKYLSIIETIKVFAYFTITLLLFMIDLKFYYFIIAFYLSEIIELILLYYPLKKTLTIELFDALKLKFVRPLKIVLKKNFHFLSFTTAPNAINIFTLNAPILLMGLFFLPEFIGNYFVAAQLVSVPLSFLIFSLSQILFPTFSLSEKKDLSLKIEEYIRHVVLVLWLPVLLFGVLLKYWGFIIIGSQDIDLVVSIINVLIIKSLITLILIPLSSIPTVLKKPQYELYWSIGSISTICIMVYLMKEASFLNMFYCYAVVNIINLVIFIVMILKMVDSYLWKFFVSIGKGVGYTLPMIFILFLPKKIFFSNKNIANLNNWVIIGCIFVGILYSLSMFFLFEKMFFLKFLQRMKK